MRHKVIMALSTEQLIEAIRESQKPVIPDEGITRKLVKEIYGDSDNFSLHVSALILPQLALEAADRLEELKGDV